MRQGGGSGASRRLAPFFENLGPLLMFALAWALLPDLPHYRTGLVLIGVARCIAMVLLWNMLACGSNEVAAVLVALNSVFQILFYSVLGWFYLTVLPTWLGADGSAFHVSTLAIAKSVLLFLGLPLAAGAATRGLLVRSKGYFAIMFGSSFVIAKKLGFSYEETASLSFTAAGNNFELAIAVSVGLFRAPRARGPVALVEAAVVSCGAAHGAIPLPGGVVMTERIIFACVHNAGRSQMAAAFFNEVADAAKARAESAGTEPGDRVHPEVVDAMREVGIDLVSAVPTLLTAGVLADASHLITMGCGESCPVAPKWVRRADWPLDDPKGQPVERVREIRDEVRSRVAQLLRQQGWARAGVGTGAPAANGTRRVTAATGDQLAAVEALLRGAALPVEGLADQFPDGYVVVERGGLIVACAGLEVHGRAGLLRSVAVLPELRRGGLGRVLVGDRVERARALHLDGVYLLTTTAAGYFARLGFRAVERATVPEALARSPELASICPASATALFHSLAADARHVARGG